MLLDKVKNIIEENKRLTTKVKDLESENKTLTTKVSELETKKDDLPESYELNNNLSKSTNVSQESKLWISEVIDINDKVYRPFILLSNSIIKNDPSIINEYIKKLGNGDYRNLTFFTNFMNVAVGYNIKLDTNQTYVYFTPLQLACYCKSYKILPVLISLLTIGGEDAVTRHFKSTPYNYDGYRARHLLNKTLTDLIEMTPSFTKTSVFTKISVTSSAFKFGKTSALSAINNVMEAYGIANIIEFTKVATVSRYDGSVNNLRSIKMVDTWMGNLAKSVLSSLSTTIKNGRSDTAIANQRATQKNKL